MQLVYNPFKLLKHYFNIILGQSRERDRKGFSKGVPLKFFSLAFRLGPLYCRIARAPILLPVRPCVQRFYVEIFRRVIQTMSIMEPLPPICKLRVDQGHSLF